MKAGVCISLYGYSFSIWGALSAPQHWKEWYTLSRRQRQAILPKAEDLSWGPQSTRKVSYGGMHLCSQLPCCETGDRARRGPRSSLVSQPGMCVSEQEILFKTRQKAGTAPEDVLPSPSPVYGLCTQTLRRGWQGRETGDFSYEKK